jgi:hypothetical protein
MYRVDLQIHSGTPMTLGKEWQRYRMYFIRTFGIILTLGTILLTGQEPWKKHVAGLQKLSAGPKPRPKTHARAQNSRCHQTPRAEQKISKSSRPRPETPRRRQYSNPSPVHRFHAARVQTPRRRHLPTCRLDRSSGAAHCRQPPWRAAHRRPPPCVPPRSSVADCKGARAALHRSSGAASPCKQRLPRPAPAAADLSSQNPSRTLPCLCPWISPLLCSSFARWSTIYWFFQISVRSSILIYWFGCVLLGGQGCRHCS